MTGRRADGFHNLYTLMTRITLHDDLIFDFSGNGIKVSCDHPLVPEDDSNLVYRAAALFFEAAGIKEKGVSVRIEKRIPPGGGLGGGSSNAAVTLTTLNEAFDSRLSTRRLQELGLMLGADIPFFIQGAPAIAQGVGEKLSLVEKIVPCHLVLCDPGVQASTADVYKNLDFRLTEKQFYNINSGLNVPMRGQKFDPGGELHNDLEDPACRLYPVIRQTKEEMALLLGKQVNMTGSGASLFALYPDRHSAELGFSRLNDRWAGTKKRVFLSSFV